MMNDLMTDDGRPETDFYEDIARFLELTNEQLDFALAAWSSYRSADGHLVEMIVNEVQRIGEGQNHGMKEPYFKKQLQQFPWIRKHPRHVKAITLASCKHNALHHPELVRQFLNHNEKVSREVLLEELDEMTDNEQPTTEGAFGELPVV